MATDGGQWSCGQVATRRISELAEGRDVRCRQADRDNYDRVVAICEVAGMDRGQVLVTAWAYRYFSTTTSKRTTMPANAPWASGLFPVDPRESIDPNHEPNNLLPYSRRVPLIQSAGSRATSRAQVKKSITFGARVTMRPLGSTPATASAGSAQLPGHGCRMAGAEIQVKSRS